MLHRLLCILPRVFTVCFRMDCLSHIFAFVYSLYVFWWIVG
jgi:hypothetical protein